MDMSNRWERASSRSICAAWPRSKRLPGACRRSLMPSRETAGSRAANWDQSLWPGGAFPTANVLDAVAPKRPVWLRRVDGHAGWANSEAMRRAGINRDTKASSDGQILRDPEGKPTGVFIDGAMGMIGRVVPPPSREVIRSVAFSTPRKQSSPRGWRASMMRVSRRPRPRSTGNLIEAGNSGCESTAWPHPPMAERFSSSASLRPRPPRTRGSSSGRSSCSSTVPWGCAGVCCSSLIMTIPATRACNSLMPECSRRPRPWPFGTAGRSPRTRSAIEATLWCSTPTSEPCAPCRWLATRDCGSSTRRWSASPMWHGLHRSGSSRRCSRPMRATTCDGPTPGSGPSACRGPTPGDGSATPA